MPRPGSGHQPVVLGLLADDPGRSWGLVCEDVAHGHPELGDEGVEGAHRGIDPVEFDLGDEARRDPDPARELTQADTAPFPLSTQTASHL